jgi:hypothetical protein
VHVVTYCACSDWHQISARWISRCKISEFSDKLWRAIADALHSQGDESDERCLCGACSDDKQHEMLVAFLGGFFAAVAAAADLR